jgi:prolyl-tRNA synthetase
MTHGDDDGLRVPPAIAPHQIVIIPMLREAPEDAELIEYCQSVRAALAAQSALGERLRVLLDTKPGKAAAKRWDWVRKGAPVIIEVGPRDMAEGKIAVVRRDQLWNAANGKPAFTYPAHGEFVAEAGTVIEAIQSNLYNEARERRDANITRGVSEWQAVADHFGKGGKYPGWVEVEWSKPTGAALDAVVEKLKALKLTIRNVPRGGEPASGICVFTGDAAVERILVARAY